jgi:hypothetical protein
MRKFLFVILALLLLCSCATKTKIEYVDREVVKYQKQFVHDTLIQHTHDSVLHTIIQKGDTVFDTQYIVKTKYQDRVVYKTDTCFRDSVQTQIKENVVEKKVVPKWCYLCLGCCLIFFIYAIIKIIVWKRTK